MLLGLELSRQAAHCDQILFLNNSSALQAELDVMRAFAVLILAIVFAAPSAAREWYEDIKYQTEDPFRLTMLHAVPGPIRLFKGPPKTESRIVSQGYIWAVLTKQQLQEIEKPDEEKFPEKVYVAKRTKLDAESSAFWKKHFQKKADNLSDGKVNFVLDLALLPFGKAVSLPAAVLKVVADDSGSAALSYQELATLISEGGEFIETYHVTRDDKNRPYFHDNLFYRVKVGKETRNIFIRSTLWAVEVKAGN